MDFSFSISFGNSDSTVYEKAIEYASEFEHYTPIGPNSKLNIVETGNKEVLAKYDIFQKLINTIGDWKSAVVSFGNKEIDPVSFFIKIKDIAECSLGYMEAKNQEVYCDDKNPGCWGCRQLFGMILNQSEAPYNKNTKYWYQYGAFKNKTTWIINKEEITRVLTDIVDRRSIDFCPIFKHSFFRKYVASLPSSMDVSDTEHWGMVYLDETLSTDKQWQPINIYHKTSLPSEAKVKKTTGKDFEQIGSAIKETKSGKPSEIKKLRNIPEITFDDIGGIDDIIQKIREVIELPFKQPDLYNHLGVKPYRGIMLWGEPGNGKTLIAKAIANEVKAHFIPVGGPDILNKNFGESEKNLRDIFEEARELQPSIIFFDEIDSIAQSRLAGETSKWYATVVNQLMSLLDGIKEFGNVTVLASTNRPDLLDSALLRPGRFDYILEVKKPNLPGCKKVLDIATRGMPLADDVDLFSFAESVVGYSAAQITFIAKEAAMVALRRTIDIKSIITEDKIVTDFSHIEVKRSDFLSALIILKWNSKYVNKTYSLKV